MKKTDIIDQIGGIEYEFIMEAEEAVCQKRYNKKRIITLLAAAACICITLIPAGMFMHSISKNRIIDPDISTNTPNSPDKTTFEIDGGKLLAYTGTETDVVIPDDVTEITSGAFEKSPASNKIEIIRLGANTSKIETSAFTGLFSLNTIEISEDNDYFRTAEGMLFSTDGTLVFALEREQDINEALYTIINKILDGSVQSELVSKIVVGGAVIDVNVSYDKEKATDSYSCVVTAIHAYGQTAEFEVPLELRGSLYSMNVVDYNGQFIAWYNFLTGDEDTVSGYEMCILNKRGVFTYRRGYELYHVTDKTYLDLSNVLNDKLRKGEKIPERVALVFDDIENFSIIAQVCYNDDGEIFLIAEKAYAFYRVFNFDNLITKSIIERGMFDIFHSDDIIAVGIKLDQGMIYRYL